MGRGFACAALIVLTVIGVAPARATSDPAPPPLSALFGGPFELVNQDGGMVTDSDFRGRYMLIYFGYSFCPDTCPFSLQTMVEALELTGKDAEKVQPLFITTDPARDTPAVLKDYVAQFGPDLIGLTGSEMQIRRAAKSYRVNRRKVIPADQENANDYFVDHSSLVYLMGPDGEFLTFFPYDTAPAIMAARITKYVMEFETAADSGRP